MENSKFKFPTELVDLPSKGLLYEEDNPLSKGKIEMKYMSAKEEDILTNQSYIQKGIVLDKLIESLLVEKINIKDLLIGDKNALLVACRVLGYGKDYTFNYQGEEYNIDLSLLENKEFNEGEVTKGVNSFNYTLPFSNTEITYKLLNGHDETQIEKEIEGMKKINKNLTYDLTTRLKYLITSVEGDTDKKTIRDFVDNYLLAKDSKALRDHIRQTQPDVDLTFKTYSGEEATIPINLNFFWPDL
jgi:hypothetical protein